jgi:hypothetical protein
MKMSSFESRVESLLKQIEMDVDERLELVRLMNVFAQHSIPPDPFELYPDYAGLKDQFLKASQGDDAEALEESFLALYCHLHGHEAPYTLSERQRMDETGGYWCHAGGISPVIKAGKYIRSETVSADFGAGNGLQGLLIQKLHPHKKTIQIEIASQMVEAGKHLQDWLEIPKDRVQWIVGDVIDHTPKGMDFIYLYRPVRPEGEGIGFYQRFVKEVENSKTPVIIFSIADCLRSFFSPQVKVFYSDGHLTCFEKK